MNKKSDKKDTKHIIIKAKDFSRGNLNPGHHDFGKDLVIDGGKGWGYAEYEFHIEDPGDYRLFSRYASGNSQPVDISVDDSLLRRFGLMHSTGGSTSWFLRWHEEAGLRLEKGKHNLKIKRRGFIPHIEQFAFIKGEMPKFIAQEPGGYIPAVKESLNARGLKGTLGKISSKLKGRYLKDRYLEILGVYDGEYGYKGPFHVQIDLTNDCNNNCIACWCNSPLLKPPRLSEEEKRQYLPFQMVRELLDEITKMGATEVYFSGSGEPFMHPQIMEVLEYAKSKHLICHVNTNFTLVSKERLDCLIKIGVDFLTVSTWSGTAATYAKTHPNKSKDDFHRMKENLLYLNKHKRMKPLIKLYEVIFNMNYFEIEKMIEFAVKTNSESLEFTLVDTMPKATDALALNKVQLNDLYRRCQKIKSTLTRDNRIRKNGVLLFQFDQFLRRISVESDVEEAKYDRNIIDSMPCYIGWLFARIVPNGEVHSCLKAHRIPTGSLYEKRFSEIWNSVKQKHFRKKTLVYRKSDPFFRCIGNDPQVKEAGCYKSCDDIGRNTWMHKRIKMLTPFERLALKTWVAVLRNARKTRSRDDGHRKYDSDPLIAGIIQGRKAYVGPEQVVIDPTNRCNLRCSACWIYSPLVEKNRPPRKVLDAQLSKEVLIRLVDDLSAMGTKRIRFTGGGEPFMHKDLFEVIERARKKDLTVAITSNFGLVSKDQIKRLVDLGIDELALSIWASSPDVYRKVHPNTSGRYFERLKDNLVYLKQIKKEGSRVTFANVITSSNCHDFEQMYEFGRRQGADAIYFTLVDVFSEPIKSLLLDETQRKTLVQQAAGLRSKSKDDSIQLEFFDGFLRRLLRSKEDFEKGEYDKGDIDKIPCYVGWIFSRVSADGSVAPCCRGVKKIMGNINDRSFKEIWFSDKYNEFRARAKFSKKAGDYFKEIGCIKECDNMMHNEETHRRLKC